MVKCTIINCTKDKVIHMEGNAGYYRMMGTISVGERYILKLDGNATFREYALLVVKSITISPSISTDDLQKWSEICIIQEGLDGAFKWVGTINRVSKEDLETARESAKGVYSKFEEALESCDDLEKSCERVKICRHQCNHVLKTYKEGIQKMALLYSRLIQNNKQIVKLYVDYRLTKLAKSLDSLEYIVCDAKDLLDSCAEDLGKVALVVSIQRPPGEKDMEVYSDFDLLIRELEWHLDVIKYLVEPSRDADFVWSPTMCRYVLAQKNDHEKPRTSFARMDREELQSGLQDGSIYIPNTMIHDTIMKRLKTQVGLEAFEIDHLDLDLQHTCTDGELGTRKYKKLGGGSSKKVYEGNWHGQSVAIATLKLGNILDDSRKEAFEIFRKEVKGLLQLQHPKVVSLFGWAETTDAPAPIKKPDDNDCVDGGYIVTEKMDSSLDKLIQMRKADTSRYDSGPFSNSVGIDILLQIVEAMLHVHNHGVMHRDLKPGNFLVNPRSSPARPGADTYYNVKLIDFGSSKVFVREDGNTCNVGTAGFGPPEMMKKALRGKYGMSVDVFSFAMTCYQVITGRKLFEGTGFAERVRNKERPQIASTVLHDLKKLTEECWHDNPKKRPKSFREIQKRLWTIKMKLALEECWNENPEKQKAHKRFATVIRNFFRKKL